MQVLTDEQIEQVSGGAISAGTAMKITLGLMIMGAESPVVIGVGAVALIAHAFIGKN